MRISTIISDIIQIINRSHSDLQNLSADDHTQYLNVARHDLTTRHTLGTVVPHDSFLGLSDTPASFTAKKAVAVNAAGDGLEFKDLADIILTTQGDILIRGASGLERLAIGAAGKYLKSQGAGANPVWSDLPSWEKLGETILSAANSHIVVDSLPARNHLQIIAFINGASAGVTIRVIFNDDASAIYDSIQSKNGNASAALSGYEYFIWEDVTSAETRFIQFNILNLASYKKYIIGKALVEDNGSIYEIGGNWGNTANQITKVDFYTGSTTTFGAGSRVTVFGRD